VIDPDLLEAYGATEFVIEGPRGDIMLRVGEHSRELDDLLASHGAEQCAFITAWNPGSRRLSAEENGERHHELVRTAEERQYPSLPGRGEARSRDWPLERSLLIIGIPEHEALQLGRRYGQLAIVFATLSKPVELVLCNSANVVDIPSG